MKTSTTRAGWVVACSLAWLLSAPAAHAASIDIGTATGVQGGEVNIAVSLQTMDASVIGTQNTVEFDRQTPIAAQPDGDPDCTRNEAIGKNGTVFRFLPIDCQPDVDCEAVRAVVLAVDNVEPIPDGSVLYTCRIAIAGDAAIGPHALRSGEARASADLGETIPTVGTNGVVEVASALAGSIGIGSASAFAGDGASFDVTLDLQPDLVVEVVAAQNDIVFDPQTPIAAAETGRPDCTVNPAIEKAGSTFAFLPAACHPDVDCTSVRAIVGGSLTPIADGAVLYTCNVQVADDAAPGSYSLTAAMPMLAGSEGESLAALSTDGAIEVLEPLPICLGDCDGSRTVTVNELLLGVSIAIGSASLPACDVFDGNLDGRVAVSELVRAVNNALRACA